MNKSTLYPMLVKRYLRNIEMFGSKSDFITIYGDDDWNLQDTKVPDDDYKWLSDKIDCTTGGIRR